LKIVQEDVHISQDIQLFISQQDHAEAHTTVA